MEVHGVGAEVSAVCMSRSHKRELLRLGLHGIHSLCRIVCTANDS